MMRDGHPMDFIVRYKALDWPPVLRFADTVIRQRLYTPLMLAVAHRRNDIVAMLLTHLTDGTEKERCSVDAQTVHGISALMGAAMCNNNTALKLLTPHASLNARDNDGNTALHHALHRRNFSCAAHLISAGCTVVVENHYGFAALHLAVDDGQRDMMPLLLAAGASVNQISSSREVTPLHVAVFAGREDEARDLLACGADPNLRHPQRNGSPITTAALKRLFTIFDMLLEAGADVNTVVEPMGTCLTIAAFVGAGNVMRKALQFGVKINIAPPFNYSLPYSYNAPSSLRARAATMQDIATDPEAEYTRRAYKMVTKMDDASMLLVASGESVDSIEYFNSQDAPPELVSMRTEAPLSLKSMCRESIRNTLRRQGPENLFKQTAELPLPTLLIKYLVYDRSLQTESVESSI